MLLKYGEIPMQAEVSKILSNKAKKISPSPTLTIDAKAKQMKQKGIDVIGFGAGEPDFDTPPHVKKAAVEAINQGFTKYTSVGGIPELKQAICNKLLRDNVLEYEENEIVVSNGAKHSLSNSFAALLNEGDEVIIPSPYWVTYPELVKLQGGIPVIIDPGVENNYKLTVSDLEKAVSAKTKVLVLNTPSNPTGQVYSEEEIETLASFAVNNNIFVISDEVYEKLIYEGKHVSIASMGKEIKNRTILVNGASKTYSMTGWRIGYTASNREIAEAMTNIQSHSASNPGSISQMAVLAALEGSQECVEEMRKVFGERKDYMVERIDEIPLLSCLKPKGAFYLFINIKETFSKNFRRKMIKDGLSFAELLLEYYNVAVVPGEGFGAPGFIRLSFAASLENIKRGLNRLQAFVEELQ